jgi:O-antigen/teichoic acid export membrane protein
MTLAAGRYHVAIPIAEDDSVAVNLMAVAVALLTGTALLALAVLTVSGDTFAAALSLEVIRPYLWLLPVSLFGGGLYDIFTYWAIRTKAFNRIFTSKVVNSGGLAAAQIGGGVMHAGAFGLVGGHALGQLVSATVYFVRTLAQERQKLALISLKKMGSAAARYKQFPLIYAPSTLINASNLQLVPFVLTSLYGAEPTGYFALASRVVFLPMSLIGSSVSQVFYNRAAVLYETDRRSLPKLVYSISSRLSLVAAVFASILIAAGPFLFRTAFGPEWEEAGRYARILAFPQMLQFAYGPISQLFNVFQRQTAHLVWSTTLVVSSVSALIVGSMVGSVYTSLSFFAASNAVVYGGALLLFRSWLRPLSAPSSEA